MNGDISLERNVQRIEPRLESFVLRSEDIDFQIRMFSGNALQDRHQDEWPLLAQIVPTADGNNPLLLLELLIPLARTSDGVSEKADFDAMIFSTK